jgi:hypothetical protein
MRRVQALLLDEVHVIGGSRGQSWRRSGFTRSTISAVKVDVTPLIGRPEEGLVGR